MKTIEICDKIIEILNETDPEKQDRSEAVQLVFQLNSSFDTTNFIENSLTPILTTTKEILSTKKKLKQVLGKKLLKLISYLPHQLWENYKEDKYQQFERNTSAIEGQIAESLINFAKEIYAIKLDRDSFAGKRRIYALDILQSLSNYFVVPEFMELCSKSITSKSKNEFIESIECLLNYCKEKDEVPNEELISIVDKRIEKTKDRAVIVSGVNLQVETGLISDFEALTRVDEWKEKMGRYR